MEKSNIGLYEWLDQVPKPSTKLLNLLKQICCTEWSNLRENISPINLTKKQFLKQKTAGIKSWEEFEKLRGGNIN